jgi:hypothetical protein
MTSSPSPRRVIGALFGIAIAEGKIKSLDQNVGEALAWQLPTDADPALPGSPSNSC